MRDIEIAQQGSIEWLLARLGYVTASRFKDVVGSAATAQTYWNKLREERLALDAGRDYAVAFIEANSFTSPAMEHGKRMEPRARAYYELAYDETVEEVGFWRRPGELKIGASLDGVTGADQTGIVEIKCPYNLEVHARTCREGMPAEHIPQIQGGMWVAGKRYCDFISYNPDHTTTPLYVQRIPRDDQYIQMLEERVTRFAAALDTEDELYDSQPEQGQAEVPDLF